MLLYGAYAAAIFFPCHPYIWSTTVLHDIHVIGCPVAYNPVPDLGLEGPEGSVLLLLLLSSSSGGCPFLTLSAVWLFPPQGEAHTGGGERERGNTGTPRSTCIHWSHGFSKGSRVICSSTAQYDIP